MAQLNRSKPAIHTHEGAKAKHIKPELLLRRSVMSCMLWEDQFYEDGISIAERINDLVLAVDPKVTAALAVEARSSMNLRHVPLLLTVALARRGDLKSDTLEKVIQRPDELTEFLALYWKDGKVPLATQVKKGLAQAFTKFNAYSLAKYNRTGKKITLRDVMLLCHPKPVNPSQSATFRKLANRQKLETPDTWETNLSSGKDKRETWIRLIEEEKLGGLATLRNLRNMEQANVPTGKIRQAINQANYSRVLPFRFIAAARYAPRFEPELEKAMLELLTEAPKLEGRTAALIDVSGSMFFDRLSSKSDMTRADAGYGVAMCLREMCDDIDVFTFSATTKLVPARHGFALRDAMHNSQSHCSTYLGSAVKYVSKNNRYERIVVITDEQSHDSVPNPSAGVKGYMINVASYKNGVGYGPWVHIDGFSESVIKWIIEYERI